MLKWIMLASVESSFIVYLYIYRSSSRHLIVSSKEETVSRQKRKNILFSMTNGGDIMLNKNYCQETKLFEGSRRLEYA